MSNLIAEGFATYGTGIVVSGTGTEAVGLAMLAGVYAELPVFQNALYPMGIDVLPWDLTNPDLYLYRAMRATSASEPAYPNASVFRRALPVAAATCIISCYFATDFISSETELLFGFADNLNGVCAWLGMTPSGQLYLVSADLTTVYTITSGPVIVASTATHLEMKIIPATGTFELRVNEVVVLNLTGATFTNANSISQVRIFPAKKTVISRPTFYMSNWVVRDGLGTVNNTFQGDRRVATLFVNSDDVAHQGWTPNYLHKFGTGILDLTAGGKTALTIANNTYTNLGTGDFTLESQVRFNVLPTGSNKATIFGKWDAGAQNKRSYQLYKGGPSLNSGATVFQISTSGLAGTVTLVLSTTAWVPVVNQWYAVAVERKSSVTTLYIDGIPIAFAADANDYYTGTEPLVIGCEAQGSTTLQSNTSLNGWMDELRFTVGTYRYGTAYAPQTVAFPRNGFDASWANVAIISSFDDGVVADESSHGLTITAWNDAASLTPDDGSYAYQTLNKPTPSDDNFIAAEYLQATGLFTMTGLPANNDTVTVATKTGPAAAVYRWRTVLSTAFDVLIGAAVADCLANLTAAINLAAGAGTLYGTSTTANLDVTAAVVSASAMEVTAIVPGTAGNALASTKTGTAGSWGAATLTGGANIPGYSQFSYERLPTSTTVVDSVTMLQRTWKSDSGTAKAQASFVGPAGGVLSGTDRSISTVPTVYLDTIEVDPDSGPLTPTSVALGKLRINRTA